MLDPVMPRETRFDGIRVRYDSAKSYDDLVAALLADVGDRPVPIEELSKAVDSWESYSREIESQVGPSGFMLFMLFDHGGWIKRLASTGKCCAPSSVIR